MQIDASKSQGFAFSYTTSSGKNLSFAMFDKSELSVSKDASSTSLSLTREYGYSFSYEGSKLTNEDLAEIKNAMQELSPSINEFLQSSKVGEMNPREVISSAMKMADLLPSSSDENFTQASFSSLANKINELLNKNKSDIQAQNQKMLEDSKSLFDEILRQIRQRLEEPKKDELGFYA